MKAIRVHEYGSPDVLKLETVDDPHPGAGQLLIRLKAIGVNPVETYVRSGAYAVKPPLPYTPGSDAAGVVENVGPNVSRYKPGDRVYIYGSLTGAYAEFVLCLEKNVYPLPPGISFEAGASLGVPYATAHRALFHRGRAQKGESILIHGGSGGVGIAAVQLARAAGLTVIATAGTAGGLERVAAAGAHHALDHTQAGHMEQAMKLTDGRGVNVILEMLANVNLGKDLPALAKEGRVVVVGNRGTVEIDPRMIMRCDGAILGMTLFNASDSDLAAIHAALGDGLKNGTLQPVVGKKFPLAEASRAHVEIMQPGSVGKIILIP